MTSHVRCPAVRDQSSLGAVPLLAISGPTGPDTTITRQAGSRGPVMAVTGELDQDTSAPLEIALLTAIDSSGDVSCDLSGVTFLGAAGAGALVRAHEHARANAVTLTIRGAQGLIEQVLRIAGLDGLLASGD